MTFRVTPAALLLGAFAAAGVQADTSYPTTLTVTATRSAQTVDDSLASVTVIDRTQIERSQASSLPELLGSVPGVQFTRNGGRGKNSSLFLRGTNADQVLVLIDGIKVGSATTGTTAFEHIALDQIARIEVVRGPRSSLYGSEAVGGVIQIFTRKGGEGLRPQFSVGAGSHDSYETTLGLSGGKGNGWYNLSLSDFSTNGINAEKPGTYGYNPDTDGYDNRSFSLSGGYRFDNRGQLSLQLNRTLAENAYDGGSAFNAYVSHVDLETLGSTLQLKPTDSWGLDLTLGRSLDRSSQYGDGVYQSHIDTTRDTLSLMSRHEIGAMQRFNWGVDYLQDRVDSTVAYARTSRDNTGLFGLYQLYVGRQDLAFSLRHDDNQQFGGHNTGSLAWGLALPRDLRLRASYGTAFRAPTFNQLYWPDVGYYKGNPDLKPETTETLELGLSGRQEMWRWSANVYRTDIDNLINYDASYGGPVNVSSARILGLELIASAQLAQWDLRGSLSLLDPRNQDDGSVLNRRAHRVLDLSADRQVGRSTLGGLLRSVGQRPDGSHRLDAYTRVDLRGGYAIARDWAVKARIENLFDTDYETAYGYNQDGRTYWLSLHYSL